MQVRHQLLGRWLGGVSDDIVESVQRWTNNSVDRLLHPFAWCDCDEDNAKVPLLGDRVRVSVSCFEKCGCVASLGPYLLELQLANQPLRLGPQKGNIPLLAHASIFRREAMKTCRHLQLNCVDLN